MTLSKEIIEILDYIGNKLGIAIDWTSDNVLPYLEDLMARFIQWEYTTSTAWIIISGAIILLSWIVGCCIYRNTYDSVAICVPIVLSVIFTGVICFQIFDMIACNYMPEKVIYDYVEYHLQLR